MQSFIQSIITLHESGDKTSSVRNNKTVISFTLLWCHVGKLIDARPPQDLTLLVPFVVSLDFPEIRHKDAFMQLLVVSILESQMVVRLIVESTREIFSVTNNIE